MDKVNQNIKIATIILIITIAVLSIIIIIKENKMLKQTKKINIIENRPEEFVFSFTIEEFINSYNNYATVDKKEVLIPPITSWKIEENEKAIHTNYETNYSYCEMKDGEKLELPRFGIYTPTNSNNIQEITIKLDHHSFSEVKYQLYEEMCYYTLKILFPDIENKKITEMYKTLNNLADENIYPQSKQYGNGAIPYALYYKNEIGVYSYFAIGDNLRLCIIPINEQIIKELEEKGTRIYEI